MLTVKLGDILKGADIDDGDTVVYVVRDGDFTFYVGMSIRGCVERIQQHCGMLDSWHNQSPRRQWEVQSDTLGKFIYANLPTSTKWQVDLLTLEDCSERTGSKIVVHKFSDPKYLAMTAEGAMIATLQPYLNVMGNSSDKRLPNKYIRQTRADNRRCRDAINRLPDIG